MIRKMQAFSLFVAIIPLVLLGAAGPDPSRSVVLTEAVIEGSAGDLSCYKVETPGATYYLEKSGAGLCRLVDRDGRDWLGFHDRPGSGAGGEFRGFPNAVHDP